MSFAAYFFKGTHAGLPGVYNRAVRARGCGPYSHVELRFSDGLSASSSYMDGGVRFKDINFDPASWDVIALPAAWEAFARQWFEGHAGWGYDVMGNVFLALGFFRQSESKVFCSEAVAGALGIEQAFRLEPNTLYPVLLRLVDVHRNALAA
jgi:hypothetical protein